MVPVQELIYLETVWNSVWQKARSSEPEFLRVTRAEAWERFYMRGWPQPGEEAFRFTSFDALKKQEFTLSQETFQITVPTTAQDKVIALPCFDVHKRNPEMCMRVLSFSSDAGNHPFDLLSSALFSMGVVVIVSAGTQLKEPIVIDWKALQAKTMRQSKLWVVIEKDAEAIVVERFAPGQEQSWNNSGASIMLETGARLEHVRLAENHKDAYHTAVVNVIASQQSSYTAHFSSFGGAIHRLDTIAKISGGAQVHLNGLYFADEKSQVDHKTLIDHSGMHGVSRELFKGVLTGRARAVFNGKIIVRPRAQKTDAELTNRNLLLSDSAWAHTKPDLEIFANDVKCKHGATVGQIAADALFYLRSRGLDESSARRLLIEAFALEMPGRIQNEPARKIALESIAPQIMAMESAHV